MKKIIKRLSVFTFAIFFSLSSMNITVNANPAAGVVAKEVLKTIGYSALGTGTASIVSHLMDSWLGTGKEYYDSTGANKTMNYYGENTNFGEMVNSGADNENCYNTYSSTVEDNRVYSLVQNVDNSKTTLYCPITQQYVTTNNITYNQQYDTYFIENNEYNYYITNNYTYVSYYIINNETQEDSYYEIYYELPDGRNSYDLRSYEVWGEYFVYDVVGYDSIKEDDGKTLALYHLNGNAKDSSYWNNPDMSIGSGVYSDAKFGSGLVSTVGSNIRMKKPENFDENNFTLEFTFVTSMTGNISFSIYDGFGYYTNPSGTYTTSSKFHLYTDVTFCSISSPGIYSFVYQCRDGIIEGYINGAKCNITTRDDNFTSNREYRGFFSFDDDYFYLCGGSSTSWKYVIDEVRLSNCALYSGDSISVMSQEFDTNQVLVTPTQFHESMIAVQANYEVTNYRVGGVRPTYPTDGYVYIYLEDDVVKDIQQFQGDGWYSINGAIRKNGKWVDLKNYDLSVLTFDDTSADDGTDSDSGTNSKPNDNVSDNDTNDNSSSGGGLSDLLDGIGGLFDGLMSIIGKVLEYIGKALDLLSGTVTKIIDIIPSNVTNMLSAIFPFIPEEWVVGIELAIVCSVILGIVRFFKG